MKSAVIAALLLLASSPALAAGDGCGIIEAIRAAIQDVCVSALAAMAVFAALCFVAKMVRRVMAKLPSVTLAVFLFVVSASSVIIGGGKTNGLLQAILPFVPQVQQVQLPQVQPVVPPSVPRISAPSPRASADMPFRARAWNRRGAWNDSFRCALPGEWVFPHGTGHLDRVEVCSQGRILPRLGSTNVIAGVGVPLQIVNPITSFGCGPTDRNSYMFAWTNAVVGRVTREDVANAETIDASIELFRNGDVAVTTNGVTELRPRVLPFPRDGYGQDDEWVTANFTNSTEILAVGYPQWVDAQVGEGLTNGLYKFTATVPDVPPETIQLKVGNYSVAVTNAGDYVFLLGKGVGYSLSVFPATATNFSYAAVDDISSGLSFQSPPDSPSGEWTVDRGRLEIVPPVYPMTLYTPRSRAMWTPCLSVSPSTWQPSALDDTETFTAVLSDIPPFASVSYRWNTSDPGVVSVASPNSKSTSMTYVPPSGEAGFPSLSLLVGVDEASLRSYFSHDWGGAGGNAVSFTVSAPEVLFVNDDDDNADGEEDFFAPGLRDDDVASGSILLHSQDSVSGVVTVDGIYGYDGGNSFQSLLFADKECTDEITVGRSFAVTQETEWSKAIYFNPATASTSYPGVQVKARWHPSEGPDLTASAFATIVSPRAEPVCNATTNVVENGEAHEYTVNPCGVGIGRVGHFRVEVAPDSFQDDKIVWEKTAGLEFVGSCTGRCVSVRGVTEGVATLAVNVGDCQSDAPTFDVHVVQNVTVNLRAWIIEGDGGERAFEVVDVRRMVKDANDVYAQVGVTLNLIEPVVVTNIPNAYDALCDTPTTETETWTVSNIVDIASGTGGLEVYFINRFVDKGHIRAVYDDGGIVVTSSKTRYTLAHEIGHAFGMYDIYLTNRFLKDDEAPLVELDARDKASWANMAQDWNGGCRGLGTAGTRYYRSGTMIEDVMPRMVMLGEVPDDASGRDITNGDVRGVFYEKVAGGKVWLKGDAPVGFPWTNRNPTHN